MQHGDPNPPGLVVLQQQGEVTIEVIEYVTSPLDPARFEIPPGFKKVDAPSVTLEQGWQQLRMAFDSWME